MFNPEEETSTAIAWISFRLYHQTFSIRRLFFHYLLLLASLYKFDMATMNQIYPSRIRVNVEVDLLGDFLKRIKIGIEKVGGDVMKKWIHIKYDYIPKYCKICMIQGHDEK